MFPSTVTDTKTVVLVVRPGTSPRRSSVILRWLRWLLPAALLVIAPAPGPFGDLDQVITIDADAIGADDALGLTRLVRGEPGTALSRPRG